MSSDYNIPAHADAHGAHEAHGAHAHHIPSAGFLTGVLLVLLAMTALTVYTALEVNLGGAGNLILAIGIATFKAALVVGFFMHLHWDNKFNAVVLLYCLIAIFTFLVFTIIDLGSRDAIDPVRAVLIEPKMVQNAHDKAVAEGRIDHAHSDASAPHGDPAHTPAPAAPSGAAGDH